MEKEFEIYIRKIVKKLDCSDAEKSDIAEEMKDHLILLKREFLDQGLSNSDAIRQSISAFGNENTIGGELQDAMFPYMKFVKGFAISLSALMTVLLIHKGLTLWNIGFIDGEGIGIYFLFLEISDSVSVSDIQQYAIGFLTVSLFTAIAPLVFLGKKVYKNRKFFR